MKVRGQGEDNEGWEVEEKARELFLKKRKEFRKEAWNDGMWKKLCKKKEKENVNIHDSPVGRKTERENKGRKKKQ